jgi:hypothetical protein
LQQLQLWWLWDALGGSMQLRPIAVDGGSSSGCWFTDVPG